MANPPAERTGGEGTDKEIWDLAGLDKNCVLVHQCLLSGTRLLKQRLRREAGRFVEERKRGEEKGDLF